MAISGVASLVVKVFLLILTFIIIGVGSYAIFFSNYYGEYQNQFEVNQPEYRPDAETPTEITMEYVFLGLSITSFLLCLVSNFLHCVERSKGITTGNVVLCAAAGLLLLIAGAILIAAAEGMCSNEDVANSGDGDSNGGSRSGRGRSSWDSDECKLTYGSALRKCKKNLCEKKAEHTWLVVSGALAIMGSLGYLLAIGLALLAKKDPPKGFQQTGAYAPIYGTPSPPQYQNPQDGSYGIMARGPRVSPIPRIS